MAKTDLTLGELVAANPAAAKILRRHGLDFCCGGKQSLREACAADGIDPDAVIREIESSSSTDGRDDSKWALRPIAELIQHILDRYHAPLRTEIRRLVELSRQVERVHADKPNRPEGLADLLVDVREAVESHLEKEEKILLPTHPRGPRAAPPTMPVR